MAQIPGSENKLWIFTEAGQLALRVIYTLEKMRESHFEGSSQIFTKRIKQWLMSIWKLIRTGSILFFAC